MMVVKAILAALSLSQGPGVGLSKYTTASYDAHASGDWLMKYLPVHEAPDDCTNRTCACGTQGRVALNGNEFGIHTVWAPGKDDTRAAANGGFNLTQIEAFWSVGLAEIKTKYTTSAVTRGWADNHVSLWSDASLDPYLTVWDADGQQYHAGSFTVNATQKIYSVLVHVPNTQLVINLQSKSCSKCGKDGAGVNAGHAHLAGQYLLRSGRAAADTVGDGVGVAAVDDWVAAVTPACQAELAKDCPGLEGKGPTCHACAFAHVADLTKAGCNMTPPASPDIIAYCRPNGPGPGPRPGPPSPPSPPAPPAGPEMQPMYVSHAVPNTSDVKAFYKAVFEVNPVYEYTDADGTRYVQFQLVPTSLVHLVFVERPDQLGTFYNALWFAKFMDTTNRKYMRNSYKGCWDLWGDNHCALDQRSIDLSIIYTRLKAAGYPLWLQAPPFGGAHIYYQDPSGWQIQLDGVFTNPPADAWKHPVGNCYTCCEAVLS